MPVSGGGSPIGFSAASFWNENPGGEEYGNTCSETQQTPEVLD